MLSGSPPVWWNSSVSFAHRVEDRDLFAIDADLVFADRVEAEEQVGAVDQVQLEQRRGGVDSRLHGGLLDELQFGELGDGFGDAAGVAAGGAFHPAANARVVAGMVAGPGRDRHRHAHVGQQ